LHVDVGTISRLRRKSAGIQALLRRVSNFQL
jgi:hypothetical protein